VPGTDEVPLTFVLTLSYLPFEIDDSAHRISSPAYDDERKRLEQLADLPEITILHIIYQQKAYEGHAKDYEFSGTSMREHWQSGYEDTRRTLKRQEWLAMPPQGSGVLVHDVHRESENF
jgi:hypothetical protein